MSDESSSCWNENVCTAFWEIRFTCFWPGDYPNKILMTEYLDNVFWYALLGGLSRTSLRTRVSFLAFREAFDVTWKLLLNFITLFLKSRISDGYARLFINFLSYLLTFEVMLFWKPLFMLFWYLQKCQLGIFSAIRWKRHHFIALIYI